MKAKSSAVMHPQMINVNTQAENVHETTYRRMNGMESQILIPDLAVMKMGME